MDDAHGCAFSMEIRKSSLIAISCWDWGRLNKPDPSGIETKKTRRYRWPLDEYHFLFFIFFYHF